MRVYFLHAIYKFLIRKIWEPLIEDRIEPFVFVAQKISGTLCIASDRRENFIFSDQVPSADKVSLV